MTSVLVLGGGPDAEREVSLVGARAVAQALRDSGRFDVQLIEITRPSLAEIRAMRADVIWPLLHGRWGEGGPMQDLLEAGGRPYVGCGPAAARLAMDKVASKALAAEVGLKVLPTCVLDPGDAGLPMPLPVVVKPIFEGSTIGLFVCRSENDWRTAHARAVASAKPYMIEPYVKGRELTLGMIERGGGSLSALPFIEIVPAEGLYDYEAKYTRDDTRYQIDPELPADLRRSLESGTAALARRMGIRHLCRADFLLDDDKRAWFLEVNTMPGFTGHSLVPMAAASTGLDMPSLCALLVERALGTGRGVAHSPGSHATQARVHR